MGWRLIARSRASGRQLRRRACCRLCCRLPCGLPVEACRCAVVSDESEVEALVDVGQGQVAAAEAIHMAVQQNHMLSNRCL